MKITNIATILLIGLTSSILASEATYEISICDEVALLEKAITQDSSSASILMVMGNLSQRVEVELEELQKYQERQQACHLKVVKSENFGDFVSYNGYHYKEILKNYPKSNLADNATYRLIYVIDQDRYNYADIKLEKVKLQQFIKIYPKSNLLKEAQSRVKEIEEHLKNGGEEIMD